MMMMMVMMVVMVVMVVVVLLVGRVLTRDEAEMFIYPSTLPTGVLPLAAKLAHLHLLSVGC